MDLENRDVTYSNCGCRIRARRLGPVFAALALSAGSIATAQDATGGVSSTQIPVPGAAPVTTVIPNAGQPPAGGEAPPPRPGDDLIQFSDFSEPVDIKELVGFFAGSMEINIVGSDALSGTVVFNAPIEVPRSQLMRLLDSLLEQHGFTITGDPTGFYRIQKLDQLDLAPGGEHSPTRIIPTPGIKPSSLSDLIQKQMTAPDRPMSKVAFVDDLGIIVITDSPRRIAALELLIRQILDRRTEQQFMRFELQFIAATVARQRVISLLGAPTQSGFPGMVPGQEGLLMGGSVISNLANLPDRLSVDAQGNALIFRGNADEAREVDKVLAVLDVPNNLDTRAYFCGSAGTAIAQIAKGRGLGEVQEVQTAAAEASGANVFPGIRPGENLGFPGLPQQSQAPAGGPTLIVDMDRGIILYLGTPAQHEQFAAIIKEFDTEQDQIVIETYKLLHQDAQEMADLILGLLNNQGVATGNAPGSLLPQQGRGRTSGGRASGSQRNTAGSLFDQPRAPAAATPRTSNPTGTSGGSGAGFSQSDDVFVLADVANNQVVVKAPGKLQAQFRDLIERLDLRRPQVYIEAKIVSVTASEEFRLAFEYQLINAGGKGGALNFNNGLSSFGTTGTFTDPKSVNTGLGGLTAALIQSDQVPVIINALQRNVDARILSSPQLLVDDNEFATLISVEQQPTTSTTQTQGNPSQTAFSGYEEAGTTLEVTPHISRGGYVRLEYAIIQSAFTAPGAGGLPGPRLQNEVNSSSVTVPSDTTVVVGGLTVSSIGDTIVKVPLIGDLPLVGHLFRDTNKNDRKTTLYVFLTPRILQNPTIRDLTLLTRGPQAEAALESEIPDIEPAHIEIVDGPARGG